MLGLNAFDKRLVWGIAAALLLAACLGGWWGYSGYRKTSLRQAVVPQVEAADARLRAALGTPLESDPAQAEQAAAQLDAAAQDIEARRAALGALDAAPDRARVESAKEALDDAAAIVRRQAAVLRGGLEFAQAREALQAHMRGARSRRRAWVSEAIELKHKMDRAYFNYKYALDGLAARLTDVPDQDLAAQARERVEAALKHAAAARAAARRL